MPPLSLGSFMTGFLIPISYIFLGSIVNQNNQEGLSMSNIMETLGLFLGNLAIATIFAYLERYCLNGFAGTSFCLLLILREYDAEAARAVHIRSVAPRRGVCGVEEAW